MEKLDLLCKIVIIKRVENNKGGEPMNTKRYNISLMEEDMEFLKAVADEKNLTTSYLLTLIIKEFKTVGICDIEAIEKHNGKRKAKLNV